MAPEARFSPEVQLRGSAPGFSPGERRLEWPEAREWLRGRRRGVRGEPRRSTRESRGVHPGGRRRTRESPRGVLCGPWLPAASSPGSPGDRTSCAPRRPGDGGCRSHSTAVGGVLDHVVVAVLGRVLGGQRVIAAVVVNAGLIVVPGRVILPRPAIADPH